MSIHRKICWAIIALLFITGLGAYFAAGDMPVIAIHFNAQGEPDFTAPPFWAFFNIPITGLGLMFLFKFIHRFEKKKENIKKSSTYIRAEMILIYVLLLIVQIMLVAHAYDIMAFNVRVIFAFMGVFLIISGNYMPKSRHNIVIGLQTPWTLKSEQVWIRTHRLAGRLFILGGAIIAATAFFLNTDTYLIVLFTSAFLPILLPSVLSYIYWRQEQKTKPKYKTTASNSDL